MTDHHVPLLSPGDGIRASTDRPLFPSQTVYVSMPPQTIYVSGLDPHQENVDVPVRVLNTDTISQTKEKSLDSIYRSTPFSMRPRKDDLDLGEERGGGDGRCRRPAVRYARQHCDCDEM